MRRIRTDNIATNSLLGSVSACPFIGQETIESREAKISLAYGDPLYKKKINSLSTRKFNTNLSKILDAFEKPSPQKNHVSSCKECYSMLCFLLMNVDIKTPKSCSGCTLRYVTEARYIQDKTT